MRIDSALLAGAVGLALAAGAPVSSQAEGPTKSWGTKTTTYWSSDSTGQHEPGSFMGPAAAPEASQPAAAPAQQRMYYQAPAKRMHAPARPRRTHPGMPQRQQPSNQGTQPK